MDVGNLNSGASDFSEHLEVLSSCTVEAWLGEFWALHVRCVQLCGSLNILWHCLSLELEWKLTFPVLWPLLSFPNLLAYWVQHFNSERLLLNNKTPGFLASRGDKFDLGSETRQDHSELLCNKVLLKYKGDRESFWHKHQKGAEREPPSSLQLYVI